MGSAASHVRSKCASKLGRGARIPDHDEIIVLRALFACAEVCRSSEQERAVDLGACPDSCWRELVEWKDSPLR